MSEENTSLIKFNTPVSALQNIEAIASQCALQLNGSSGNFQRALTMAAGIRMLREALSAQIMSGIMALQGSKLGFRTDKDAGQGYPVEIVKDCVIEHVLRGGMLVGNEMNIIAGNAYQTKEFFTRMLAELPGFTDLKLFPGVPVSGGDRRSLVAYTATWKFNGQPGRIDRVQTKSEDGTILDERLSIITNNGMGPDAVLGKAERKIKAAIYARCTGTIITDADIDDAPARKPVANLGELTQRLENRNGDSALQPGETMKADGEIVKTDESSQLNVMEETREMFEQCNSVSDARAIYDLWCSPDSQRETTPEQREQIAAWRDAAMKRIDPPASKSKQKELAGAK